MTGASRPDSWRGSGDPRTTPARLLLWLLALSLLVACDGDPAGVPNTTTGTSPAVTTTTASTLPAGTIPAEGIRLEYRSESATGRFHTVVLATDGRSTALHVDDRLRVTQDAEGTVTVCWRSQGDIVACPVLAGGQGATTPLFDQMLAALRLPFDRLTVTGRDPVPTTIAGREAECEAVRSPEPTTTDDAGTDSTVLTYCRDRLDGVPLLAAVSTANVETRPLELIVRSTPRSDDFDTAWSTSPLVSTAAGTNRPEIDPVEVPTPNLLSAFTNEDVMYPKLELITRPGARYPVIFFGSSHVHRGFVPGVFDAIQPEKTLEPSFNMGVSQMGIAEAWFVIRRLAEAHPALLEVVLLEPRFWSEAASPPLDEFDVRFAYWHDSAALGMVAADLEDREKRAPAIVAHLQATLWTEAGIVDALRPFVLPTNRGAIELGTTAGFESLDDLYARAPTQSLARSHEEFVNGTDIFVAEVAELADATASPAAQPVGSLVSVISWMSDYAADHGFELLLVDPPGGVDREWSRWAIESGAIGGFNLNDPAAHPELFDPGLWWDRGHLSEQGAERFTSVLAEEFSAGHHG